MTFANGLFVAVGRTGRILASSDGSKWATLNSVTANSLSTIAFGNGSFVAVGDYSAILQSDSYTTLEIEFNSGPVLKLSGEPARVYQLEYSDEVATVSWHPLAEVTLTNSPQPWRDATAANSAARYYRCYVK